MTAFNLCILDRLVGFVLTHIFKQHILYVFSVPLKIPGLVSIDVINTPQDAT